MSLAERPSPARAIALKLAAVAAFVTMATCIKATAPHVPAGEAAFARALFAIPVILAWLAWRHDLRDGLKTHRPWGHAWRGLIGSTAMLTGFGALMLLPLPQATALSYAIPILTVVLAVLVLRERIRMVRISAVAMGVVGIGIILWPDLVASSDGNGVRAEDARTLGVVLALVSALLGATAQIVVRRLVRTEETPAIVFYFMVSATLVGLLTWPTGLFGPWVVPTPVEAALLVSSGLLGGFGQAFLTSAYRYADASLIAPFDYASMIFAILIGYALFDEVPRGSTLVGAAVVIAAGALIIWREARLGIRREPSRRHATPQG